MRCFPIVGMKKKHDAILESFGTTEENIYSLTRLPSTTYSLLPSSLFDFKTLNLPPLFVILDRRNYSKSIFDVAAKSPWSKLF